jgi:hypothetical protein
MAALVAAIHAGPRRYFLNGARLNVDGRLEAGHDAES